MPWTGLASNNPPLKTQGFGRGTSAGVAESRTGNSCFQASSIPYFIISRATPWQLMLVGWLFLLFYLLDVAWSFANPNAIPDNPGLSIPIKQWIRV